MPIKRTCPGAGCRNGRRENGGGGGVLERGEFGDEFVMFLPLMCVTTKAAFGLNAASLTSYRKRRHFGIWTVWSWYLELSAERSVRRSSLR